MTDTGPYDHLAQVRSAAELADIAHSVPDDKVERYMTMVEKIRDHESATTEAKSAQDHLLDSIKALEAARNAKIADYPARTFMDEWRASVAGRV